MRLIDVNVAKKFLKENLVLPEKEFETIVSTMLDAVPTAYDLDKVVEQLEEYAHSNICASYCASDTGCPYMTDRKINCENCGAMGALEIVKAGGINENY